MNPSSGQIGSDMEARSVTAQKDAGVAPSDMPVRERISIEGDLLYLPDRYLGSKLRANGRTTVRRRESGETIHTNARGWRVRDPSKDVFRTDIMLAGCSHALGVGVEYEASIAGLIEDRWGGRVANVGAASYSLLQIARRIDQEIDTVRPKVVIIVFGGWLIDRCVKDNAHAGILFRPVFMSQGRKNRLVVREPRHLPLPFIRRYVDIMQKGYRGGQVSPFDALQVRLLRSLAIATNGAARRYLRRILGLSMPRRLDSRDFVARRQIMDYCFAQIEAACRRSGAKALLFHFFDLTSFGSERWTLHLDDREHVLGTVGNYSNLLYEPWDEMEQRVKDFLRRYDEGIADFRGRIWWTDNNHANPAGQRIVADSIASALERAGFVSPDKANPTLGADTN